MISEDNFESEIDSPDLPKKEKKRKSAEDKIKDRRVVFWVMLIVFGVSLLFWLKNALLFKKERDADIIEEQDKDHDGETNFTVKYKI